MHSSTHTVISLMSDLNIQFAGKLKDLSEHSLCVADRPAQSNERPVFITECTVKHTV